MFMLSFISDGGPGRLSWWWRWSCYRSRPTHNRRSKKHRLDTNAQVGLALLSLFSSLVFPARHTNDGAFWRTGLLPVR